jgi:hypothetical protein
MYIYIYTYIHIHTGKDGDVNEDDSPVSVAFGPDGKLAVGM